MERLHKAMGAYVRAISKRNEGEDKEKLFPIGNLGSVMVGHGEDFASNSEYGQCLTGNFHTRILALGDMSGELLTIDSFWKDKRTHLQNTGTVRRGCNL